jgi:predicted alpha/beta-hydrolase family hydrolase
MHCIKPSEDKNLVAQLILAHGAGAGSQSEFMQSIANGLSEIGIKTWLFDFPYMQTMYELGKRRPPDRAEKLKTAFLDAINEVQSSTEFDDSLPLLIAGKSMGGRIATMIASEDGFLDQNRNEATRVDGVVVLGYPFRAPGKHEIRTSHFNDVKVPTLILQGERDTFGGRELLRTLKLPERFASVILEDGDHSFKPRKASGLTQQDNFAKTIDAIQRWINTDLRKSV